MDQDVTNEYVHLDHVEAITNSGHSFNLPVVICLRGKVAGGSARMYVGKAQDFLSERGAVVDALSEFHNIPSHFRLPSTPWGSL
jgi:hypothetical protein